MKPVLMCIIVIILSAFISFMHMIFTADRVASVVGYFVSLGIVPFVISVAVGLVGVVLMGQGFVNGLKNYWWIPTSGAITAISSIGYVIWRMSQPGS